VKRVETRGALREAVSAARAAGRRIGFVPTMGYLHEGHLSLIDRARTASDFVVSSVFVNPLQFGPGEDLARYPRDLERDCHLLAQRGVDLLFAPDRDEMYPAGEPGVTVVAPALSSRLCGAFRPGHFQGVLTVVAKLFNLVQPEIAVFGRKDFQQLVLIRRMAGDLDFPVAVLEGPIVREPDGLAMSSRNVYLDNNTRADALRLYGGLMAAQDAFARGERARRNLIAAVRAALEGAASLEPQYIELVDADTLDPVEHAAAGNVLAIAAFVGGTRLIDNHTLT
jgi:pantoate--beta-alanine ligase